MTNNHPRFSILLPLLYASLLGVVGFLSGFFGPILLNPDANQGPLMGFFITGPLGVILGLILGVIVVAKQAQSTIAIPVIAALILSSFTLYRCLPEDRYQGFIIDAEVRSCQAPTNFIPEAKAKWESIKSTPDYILKSEWKSDIPRMLENDKGVVLALQVHRKRKIYEQRKPWNRGHIVASVWQSIEATENYFVRNASGACTEHQVGKRAFYYPIWEASQVSPPDQLPTFLGLYVLARVPEKLSIFAGS